MARPHARTTWGAIALAVAITTPYLGILVQSIRGAIDPDSAPEELLRDLAMFGAAAEGSQLTIAFAYLVAIVGTVTLLVLLLIAGVSALRPAAREAGFVVFGAMALIAGLATVGGLGSGGPSSGTWLGAATSLCCLGIVVLLALPATSLDFELAERDRRRLAGSRGGSPGRRER